jgi:hypothetical protein
MNTWKTLTLALALAGAASCDSGGQPAAPPETAPLAAEPAVLPRSTAPANARVFFTALESGATVASPLTIEFGTESISIAPAGTYDDATGHHHLLIDVTLADMSLPVPKDENHVHFGKGQTEATIELGPGEHTLQLILGDGNHVPHEPPVLSEQIIITVE